MRKYIIYITLALQILLMGVLLQGLKQVSFGSYFCFYQKPPDFYNKSPFVFYITVCIGGPFIEEFLLRKVLLGLLIKRFDKGSSIIFSSCVFALCHDQYWSNGFDKIGMMQMFLFGIVCGYVYLVRLSFLDSFFVHSAINTLVIFWMILVINLRIPCLSVSATVMVFYIALNLALMAALIVLLIKFDGDMRSFSEAFKHKGLALLTKFNK